MALIMLLLCVPLTASAAESEYGPEDLRSIHGIDYNRITQRATGDGKSYPVELKMGDLTFNGELTGSNGLTYEELNKIINEVLKEKQLTVEQIQLVKALAANVEDKAIEHWGLQIMEGLISYIPMNDKIASEIGGWNDIFAYMVHDMDEKSVIEYLADRQRQKYVLDKWKVAEGGLKAYEGYLEKVGRAADAISLAGEMLNTLKVAEEWLKGNERLEKYLKDLEQKMADVNDFYSECSRRANKLAEEKGAGSYVIKFDKEKNYRTYNATFWGISNIMMGATLSGVLEGSNTEGVAGTYTGTLWLDVEMVDPVNSFANKIRDTEPFASAINTWRPIGITSTTNKNTAASLTRMVQGDISVTVTNISGTQTPSISGNLTSGGDDTEFALEHQVTGSGSGTVPYTSATYNYYFSSTMIDSLSVVWEKIVVVSHPIIGTTTDRIVDPTVSVERDIGTIWEPLESGMTMTIEFGKK